MDSITKDPGKEIEEMIKLSHRIYNDSRKQKISKELLKKGRYEDEIVIIH